MVIKISHGLDEKSQKLVSIFEVNKTDNGLKCNLICPECKTKFIACIGEIKTRHFKHYNETTCNPSETIIHKLAKKLIFNEKRIFLEDKIINFKKVEEEKELKFLGNQIKPDLVCETNEGETIFLEIKVTHKVDNEKKQKLNLLNIRVYEIDLSYLKCENDIEEILKIALFNPNEFKNQKILLIKSKEKNIKEISFFKSELLKLKRNISVKENKLSEIEAKIKIRSDKLEEIINQKIEESNEELLKLSKYINNLRIAEKDSLENKQKIESEIIKLETKIEEFKFILENFYKEKNYYYVLDKIFKKFYKKEPSKFYKLLEEYEKEEEKDKNKYKFENFKFD